MISFLTPILGLYGINVKEFINEWESKTKFIDYDIVIPTCVLISKIKTFEIELKTPTITSLLSNYEYFNNKQLDLNILTLYKIVLLKSISNSFFYKKKLKIYYKMVNSYMKSINRNINYLLRHKKKTNLNFLKNLNFSNELYFNNLRLIKKLNIFNNLILNNYQYGLIFYFPGFNNKDLNNLKNNIFKYDLDILKINNKYFSLFLNQTNLFYGSQILTFNNNLSNIIAFFNNLSLEIKFKFFLFYIKLKKNICTILFFKKYINIFFKIKNNLKIKFLNILKLTFLSFLKLNIIKTLYFTKLLNYKINK